MDIVSYKFNKDEDVLLEVCLDNDKKVDISYNLLKVDNNILNIIRNEIEGYKLKLIDNSIYVLLTSANDQFGILIGYDTVSNKLVHISNAEYTVDFVINDENIYRLHYIHNFAVKPSYTYSKCNKSLMNYDEEIVHNDIDVKELPENEESHSLMIKNGKLFMIVNDVKIEIQ